MPREHFDADNDADDDYCGIVGGEVTDARFAGERGQEYDFGPVRDVSSRLSGDEYAYLGHFRQPEFASEGHNDIQMPGLGALHVPTSTMPAAALPPPQTQGSGKGLLRSLLGRGGSSEDADYSGGGDTPETSGDFDASGGGDRPSGLLSRLF